VTVHKKYDVEKEKRTGRKRDGGKEREKEWRKENWSDRKRDGVKEREMEWKKERWSGIRKMKRGRKDME
jgi:hypothetical protein